MKKKIELDKKTGIVYVRIRKGKVYRTECIHNNDVYDNDVVVVIDKDKKGNVLGVEVI